MSTKRQLDPQLTRAVVDLRAVLALHSLPEIGACEAYQTWLTDRLTPFVDRKWLYAREALFQHGDAAKHYYLVIRGALLVQRRGTMRVPPSLRLLSRGHFFGYHMAEHHFATCIAMLDSVVLAIDQRWLQSLAERSAVMADTLALVRRQDGEASDVDGDMPEANKGDLHRRGDLIFADDWEARKATRRTPAR